MGYKEELKKAREKKVDIYRVQIACEVEAFFGLKNKDFEQLCEVVSMVYLKTYRTGLDVICEALRYAIKHGLDEPFDIYHMKEGQLDQLIELTCSMD